MHKHRPIRRPQTAVTQLVHRKLDSFDSRSCSSLEALRNTTRSFIPFIPSYGGCGSCFIFVAPCGSQYAHIEHNTYRRRRDTSPVTFSNDPDIDTLLIEWDDGVSTVRSLESESQLHVHVYQLSEEEGTEEMDDDNQVVACKQWVLPSRDFYGLWESLVFEPIVKSNLLEYASTALFFSDLGVNTQLITWNRVVLLHGPPGTGKTSLCKALAQKMSIRLGHRYSHGQLVEVNAHSLFSKWFSESGKLVMKLFQKIHELVEDSDSLVCVLIDEVESLTAARKAALSGNEPSDAIRVVNALLTQIDQLRAHPNVIILTTSNIAEAVDVAFVDRADIKQYIGPPSVQARYNILRSCVEELMRVGIITPSGLLWDFSLLQDQDAGEEELGVSSLMLFNTALQAEGLSGRILRKAPFLAHAWFIRDHEVRLSTFMVALNQTIEREIQARRELITA